MSSPFPGSFEDSSTLARTAFRRIWDCSWKANRRRQVNRVVTGLHRVHGLQSEGRRRGRCIHWERAPLCV